jgi:2-polyprenyl-6-methoxyphenol hydroxylase-like FAD-dependent oxidoreductase
MNAEVTGLIEEDGAVRGVRYRTADGDSEARALLTVGADGRRSVTRAAAGLPQVEMSPPMDVFWFRLSRAAGDDRDVMGTIGPGHFLVMFDRGEYWQVGYVIPKGGADTVRAEGLAAFRASVAALVPAFAGRVGELADWDQVKLLTVRADRLTRWYRPGYLAIGDCAHAMSPVGGVGINVAIQDATAAANVLWEPLSRGRVSTADLAEVQRRREFSVRVIQAMQTVMQRQLLQPVLAGTRGPSIPPLMRAALSTPGLRMLLPSLVAYGVFRPRVHSPARAVPAASPA